jgi:hypothetical protein
MGVFCEFHLVSLYSTRMYDFLSAEERMLLA